MQVLRQKNSSLCHFVHHKPHILRSGPGLHSDRPARDPVSHFSTIRSYDFNSSGIFFCLATLYCNTLFTSFSGYQTMLKRRKNCPYKFFGSPCDFFLFLKLKIYLNSFILKCTKMFRTMLQQCPQKYFQ